MVVSPLVGRVLLPLVGRVLPLQPLRNVIRVILQPIDALPDCLQRGVEGSLTPRHLHVAEELFHLQQR